MESLLAGGYTDIMLEGDAINVINTIDCSLVVPHWSIVSITGDIRESLNSVRFWFASHVVKGANYLVHNLACWISCGLFERRISISSMSSPIFQSLQGDEDNFPPLCGCICFL